MNQAEKETIELFCRELALALRRITGRVIEIDPDTLPQPIEQESQTANETPITDSEEKDVKNAS